VRQVEVSFVGAAPVDDVLRASGVSDVEVAGAVLRCVVTGSFQPFLEALRGHEVLRFESVPAHTSRMEEGRWVAGLSPRGRARLAGIFEFLEGTASAGSQVVILSGLVVAGSAAATAHNILGNESLFRFGFLISVAGVAFHLTWALLFYQLMRVVNRTIAAVALLLVIVCSGLQALTAFFYLSPLLALQSGLPGDQAQALMTVLLKLNTAAFQLDLVFFGLWCVLTGYLIYRSTFLPRVLGVLLMIDGVGWSLYMWPPLATSLFGVIAVASAFAELPLQFWLIVFGANSERWKEQAAKASGPPSGAQLQEALA
jgi:hypothetical protein